MNIFRGFIYDVRNKQNLDIYITVLLAFTISGLGFFQVTNLTVIASAVLATLALVSVSLLVNRRENELIMKDFSKIEFLSNRLDEVVKGIDVKVGFVPEDSDQPGTGRAKVRDIISKALHEVLVLDHIFMRVSEKKNNAERKGYYDELIRKVVSCKGNSFRYRRILQISERQTISDLLSEDSVLQNHCIDLVKIGESKPEIASLKSCPPLYQGTFILIDRRYLIIEIPILDPDFHHHTDGGQFIFDDSSGTIINHFIQFFHRADAFSMLVKSKDLRN
jgi:hypothetical protein